MNTQSVNYNHRSSLARADVDLYARRCESTLQDSEKQVGVYTRGLPWGGAGGRGVI